MWKAQLQLDRYQYARTNPYTVRVIGVVGILTTLLMTYGLVQFLQINLLYMFLFGPIVAIFTLNKLMRFTLQLFFQRFDIKKHEKFIHNFWANNEEPAVDVFLPYAGEDLEVHEEVVKAVKMIDYKNINVYMLDDAGSEEHKKIAENYGFKYLSRPNKGEFKKSGNLQYGYDHSHGEFVFILDADFIPIKESLKETIPYIVADPEIGIVQTPQYFEQSKNVHKRSMIEFGGGNIVEDFYRIIMPCRDEFKAAMCVGTSAVYRRKTIQFLNSTPKVHASEDLATGLIITQFGYYVKYLPLIISMGTSPQSYQGYFKQHMRWCSGNLIFAKYWPVAQLSVMARLIYATNPLYYISEALTIVFSFQFLVLLYFHADSLSIVNTLYFLPYIVLSRIAIPLTKANKSKTGTKLAALSNSYTYFYTYIRMATKGLPTWHPTGVKINGLHEDFLEAFNVGTLISSLFITCFLFVLFSRLEVFGNFNTYIVLAWTFYSVFWHALFLTFVQRYIHPHSMANLQSPIQKKLLYAKTHAVAALFIAVIGTAAIGVFFASLDKNAPTSLAISNVLNQNKKTNVAKIASLPKKTAVLGATTSAQIKPTPILPPPTYSQTVERGDTLSSLAEKTISSYSDDINVNLTENQVAFASLIISSNHEDNNLIKPGQVITFERMELLDAMEKSLARLNN